MAHPATNKNTAQKIWWHLKVAVGAVLISIIFSLALRQKIIHVSFSEMLLLTLLQLEIFIWLGIRFFQSRKFDVPNYPQKIIWRLLLFYLSVLVIAFVLFLGIFTFNFLKNGNNFSFFFENIFSLELKGFLSATLIGFALGSVFFFYTQWNDALKRLQKLKEEKLIFQYETLKNQVNPHFLFNSLNTLSSLIRTDADLSESFIQKLSSVYRYVLENKDKEMVPLSTELKFVTDFFYLQKIRDGEKIELNIETNENQNAFILPVSVQMLVENALKHNAATRKEPLLITIHFEGIDKLVVRNDLRPKMLLAESSKIGLKNLNERCSLILNREIEIQETALEFIVKLPLKLNPNK